MREPHKKGVAHHFGPESCAWVRKDVGEALTGVRTGQVWSSEITTSVCRPCLDNGEGNMKGSDRRERSFDTAESETLGMCGNSMRENREALQTPTLDGSVGRFNSVSRTNLDFGFFGFTQERFWVVNQRVEKRIRE